MMTANKQTDARFRLSTTVSTAIALQALLAKTTDLNSELLALRGKLDIFIANIQMGAVVPSYIPKTAKVTNPGTGVQEVSLYHKLINDPTTSPEIKNSLFALSIMSTGDLTNEEVEKLIAKITSNNLNENSI